MNPARYWSGTHHDLTVQWGVLAVLFYAPLPLGSNRPYAWLILEICIFALLTFWAVGAALYGGLKRIPSGVLGILAALAGWLCFILAQTITLPAGLVDSAAPLVYSFQQNLELISVERPGTLSLDPGTTYNEFLKYGAYAAVFFLITATVRTRKRLLVGAGAVVAAGLVEALLGLYGHIAGAVPLNGLPEARAGTFVNPDHFSNFLFLVLGLVTGLLSAIFNSNGERGDAAQGLAAKKTSLIALAATAAIIFAGAGAAGSGEAGILFLIAFGITLMVAASTNRPHTGELRLAPAVLLGTAAVLFLTGYHEELARVVDRGILAGEWAWQNLLGFRLFSTVWLTGVGAGNYRWAFTAFRDGDLRFVTYDHAHNDYLEMLIEQGIVGAFLLGAAVVLILRELYKGYRVRRNPLMRGVIFGVILSMVYMLLHGLIEFNFRIPANAVYFFALSALGVAACRIDRQKSRRRSDTHRPTQREAADG